MFLPWLIILPIIGGVLCCPLARIKTQGPRWISLIVCCLILILSFEILWKNDYAFMQYGKELSFWQHEYSRVWISRFGINVHLSIDGLSLLMVLLTGLLGLMSVLCSWRELDSTGWFYFNMMLILCGVIGVFLSQDLFLFFCFWEIMIIPMYFLISLWGHKELSETSRITAALKFFLYTQSSGILLLIAIISLGLAHYSATGLWTFSYLQLLHHPQMSYTLEYILMLCFFIAFAVKLPLVPLHGAVIDAHSFAPTAGAIDLIGLLIKTAGYGLLRFSFLLFPRASINFAPIAMMIGIISIFYGSWMAFNQNDIKRMVAYTSLSHMGFLVIGIYTNNSLAYQGAVIQMIAHSLSAAGLFIVCGLLYKRLHTRNMSQIEGLWHNINYLPALTIFFALATMGLPGTGNFLGEFLILFGSYRLFPKVTIIASFGIIFATVYSLIMIQRTFFGSPNLYLRLKKMSIRECFILGLLMCLLLGLFFYPQPVLNISSWSYINIP
ncbi:MAG: NADH-quinone oxidoreductase subunit M [Candidatus Dasytiphilus stammeri]